MGEAAAVSASAVSTARLQKCDRRARADSVSLRGSEDLSFPQEPEGVHAPASRACEPSGTTSSRASSPRGADGARQRGRRHSYAAAAAAATAERGRRSTRLAATPGEGLLSEVEVVVTMWA